MHVGKVVMLVVGTLLVLLGGAAAIGALVLGWFFVVQRADGFITGPEGTLRTQTHALVSERLDLVTDDQSPTGLRSEDIGRLLVQATATDPASAVFVGIAPVGEVESYLSGIAHTVVTDLRFEPFDATYRDVPGGDTPAAPSAQQFWVASAEGTGTQQVEWDLRDGTWTVVVMNADASAGIGVDVRAGIHIDLLGPAVLALLVIGLVLLAVGVPLLLAGAVGLGRHGPPPPGPVSAPATGATPVTAPSHPAAVPYPVHLRGDLDEPLSRWLWLVKWLGLRHSPGRPDRHRSALITRYIDEAFPDPLRPRVDVDPVPGIAVVSAHQPEDDPPDSGPVVRSDGTGEETVITHIGDRTEVLHRPRFRRDPSQICRHPGRENRAGSSDRRDGERPHRSPFRFGAQPIDRIGSLGEPLPVVDRTSDDQRLVRSYRRDIAERAQFHGTAAFQSRSDAFGDSPRRPSSGRVADQDGHGGAFRQWVIAPDAVSSVRSGVHGT